MSSKKKEDRTANTFQCTAKCIDALGNKKEITGKARQYCLLLLNKDEVSGQLSDKMKNKVDVDLLVKSKFIRPIAPKPKKLKRKNKLNIVKTNANKNLANKTKKKNKVITTSDTIFPAKLFKQKNDSEVNKKKAGMFNTTNKKGKIKLVSSSPKLESRLARRTLDSKNASNDVKVDKLQADNHEHNVSPALQMVARKF